MHTKSIGSVAGCWMPRLELDALQVSCAYDVDYKYMFVKNGWMLGATWPRSRAINVTASDVLSGSSLCTLGE